MLKISLDDFVIIGKGFNKKKVSWVYSSLIKG